MRLHHTFRDVDEALPTLAEYLLQSGYRRPSRVGDTQELTFQHFTINKPLNREITTPHRKANIAAQIAETMWVLSGRNDVEWLSDYLPRAAEFSDDGVTWRAGYGPRLRQWRSGMGAGYQDQLENVIAALRQDPTTRRAVMSIWDPAQDYVDCKDVPCNNWLHFLARDGVLDLHVAIRSNDLVWGWSGINQFEWSVLLEIVAAYTELKPGRIHYSVSSLHIYERHWKMARKLEPNFYTCTGRERRFEPQGLDWDLLCASWFQVAQTIKESPHQRTGWNGLDRQIADFPEPMLRNWLRVLAWWWSGDEGYLWPLEGTRLHRATQVGTGPRKDPQQTPADADGGQGDAGRDSEQFVREVSALHVEKHKAYGDSWKRRGEMLGILANIARKVDRLGAGETSDETQTDTATDTMVYLAKYRTWLGDQTADPEFADFSDDPVYANELIADVAREMDPQPQPWTTVELEDGLREGFDKLEALVMANEDRAPLVDAMLRQAYVLAFRRWRETPALFTRPVPKDDDDIDDYRGADHD